MKTFKHTFSLYQYGVFENIHYEHSGTCTNAARVHIHINGMDGWMDGCTISPFSQLCAQQVGSMGLSTVTSYCECMPIERWHWVQGHRTRHRTVHCLYSPISIGAPVCTIMGPPHISDRWGLGIDPTILGPASPI